MDGMIKVGDWHKVSHRRLLAGDQWRALSLPAKGALSLLTVLTAARQQNGADEVYGFFAPMQPEELFRFIEGQLAHCLQLSSRPSCVTSESIVCELMSAGFIALSDDRNVYLPQFVEDQQIRPAAKRLRIKSA